MNAWQWDDARRDHYYFSASENAYVYSRGERLMVDGTSQNVGTTETYTETHEYELFVGTFCETKG